MPNITISLDNDLIKLGRDYAKKHNLSLNALIRKLLEQTVKDSSMAWLDECFKLMEQAKGNSKGRRWSRQELYNV